MNSLFILINQIIGIYSWILIINVIFSWLLSMNIFNTNNRIVIAIYYGTKKLTDPLLNPIRNFLPNFGGLDISPIILLLLLSLFSNLLKRILFFIQRNFILIMSDTKVIDGKQIAADLRLETKDRVSDFQSKYNKVPTLAVVLVGEDPASQVYVNTKTKMAKEIGMDVEDHFLEKTVSEKDYFFH